MANTEAAITALKKQIDSGDIETNGEYILNIIKKRKGSTFIDIMFANCRFKLFDIKSVRNGLDSFLISNCQVF